MEFPACVEVYAERRRLRMEKVKSLRFSKSMPPQSIPNNNNIQFIHQAPTSSFYFNSNSSAYPLVPSSSFSISIIPESASVFSIPAAKTIGAEGGNNSNDKVKNRQIKNRESALLSRKRKQDEMSYLHSKVNSLEEEIQRLKSRLIMYEGGNNNDTTVSSDSMQMMTGVGNNGGGVVVVSDSASCIDSDSVSVSSTDSCDNNMNNNISNHRRQRYQQVRPVQNNNRLSNVKNIISNPIVSYSYTTNGMNSNNSSDVSNKTSKKNNNSTNNSNMKMNYNNNKCSGVSNLEPAEFYHLF